MALLDFKSCFIDMGCGYATGTLCTCHHYSASLLQGLSFQALSDVEELKIVSVNCHGKFEIADWIHLPARPYQI